MDSTDARARTRARLICLLMATFVIGTDDFVIAGVLPAIAAEQGVGEAAAGQLVTVFSITYALAAPPLAVITAPWPRRRLVVGGLAVFGGINAVTALAAGFAMLMVLRVAAALTAAAITPAVFAMAARLAAPGRVGRAIGVVAAGLTVSLFAGVPLGSLLGSAFGWRSAFAAVALATGAVFAASALLLPSLPGAAETGLAARLRILSRPAVLLGVLSTVIGAAGGLMTYTYIAPITRDLTGREGALLAVFIAVAGLAGAAGTVVGGRLTDRWGADRALLFSFSVQLAATAGLALSSVTSRGTTPVWLVAALVAIWGFGGWAFNPPMNARMLRLGGEAGTEAVALNTSGLYVGVALGGGLGGGAVALYGGTGVALTATGIGLVTLGLMIVSV